MTDGNSNTVEKRIPSMSLLPFLLITFGLAWGILGLYVFMPDLMTGIFGQLTGNHPLFFLAVYAPAIAAVAIVARRTGPDGLRRYLSRLSLWRCSASWYLFLLLVVPLVFYAGSALKGEPAGEPATFSSAKAMIVAILLAVIKGPVEELGWRGLALPLLQRRFSPLAASLVLGAIWGFWHTPAFILSGTQQSAWPFIPFFLGTIAISVIMAALFNESNGSILLVALMHFQLMNPIWPDAQPWDTYILCVIAALIVWFKRDMMLNIGRSVTDVVPAGGAV